RFGWAKGVPINPKYFKNRKRDTIIVSLAGVFTNFTLALLIGSIIVYLPIKNEVIVEMLVITLWYNIMLGVFNLLPFPPLDGSKVIASLLPTKYEYYFYKYERYFYLVLILLIATNYIQRIIGPLVEFVYNMVIRLLLF